MRTAIATDGDNVSTHFGRCPSFTVVEIKQGRTVSREVVENPGHEPGLIPRFLKERGIECVVSGGMGGRAIQLFVSYNISTIMGVSGSIDTVVRKLEQGTLKSGESLCTGEHKGECHRH